jgi:hypothetical protein
VRRFFMTMLLLAAASGLSAAADAGDRWRLPDGADNPMPRYFDYHPPKVFYFDEMPVAFRLQGRPSQPYANGIPTYPPAVILYPAPAYPVPGPALHMHPGYPVTPVVPNVVTPVPLQPICGVFRYWRDGRCIDARGY